MLNVFIFLQKNENYGTVETTHHVETTHALSLHHVCKQPRLRMFNDKNINF